MNSYLKPILITVISGLIMILIAGMGNNYLTVKALEIKVSNLQQQINGRMEGIKSDQDDLGDRVTEIERCLMNGKK
jgi:hypothetical protein